MAEDLKQIIIDGVDVSGCSYYANGKCTNSHMIQSNCKNVAVCYYKEYKRKEQECEELKENLPNAITRLMSEIDQLKAENKELKEELEELKEENEYNEANAIEFKQTLTEIKEIAEVLITTTDEYDSCYYKDRCSKCEVKEDCQYFKVEQILQKISECEVGE